MGKMIQSLELTMVYKKLNFFLYFIKTVQDHETVLIKHIKLAKAALQIHMYVQYNTLSPNTHAQLGSNSSRTSI